MLWGVKVVTYIHTCVCVCVYVYVYMYVCMYFVYVYVCICVCVWHDPNPAKAKNVSTKDFGTKQIESPIRLDQIQAYSLTK